MIKTGVNTEKLYTILLAAFSLLLIAISIYVRIRLLNVPLERDEGEYAYMAQLLLKGIPPYTYAYTMKLPGVAMVYYVFMALFGQSTEGIRTGLILINTGSIVFVYLFGKELFSKETAIIAAALYSLLSLSQPTLGIFAHATHFVVLFGLAGMVLLKSAIQNRNSYLFLISGLTFGTAFLMKQHTAIMILTALLILIWIQRSTDRKNLLKNAAAFLTGTFIPYGIVVIWLYNAGVFDRFWFWTVSYASAYATGLSFSAGLREFTQQGTLIAAPTLPVWILAFAGIVIMLKTTMPNQDKLLLSGYLMAAFAMFSQGLYFRPHYFILLLPAVSLLAAKTMTAATSSSKKPCLSVILLVTVAAYSCNMERDYLFSLTPVEISRKINGTNPFPEAIRIADYLREQTAKTDKIAILGSEPEILFYADRLSATGHIYMYGLMEEHKYAEEMQRQLISEIEATAPAFIVVVHNSTSWLLRTNSLNRILDWGDSYISLRYDEVGIVDIPGYEPARYLWGAEVLGYEPVSDSFVSIFRRRW